MDTISDRKRDSGTAYGRKAQSHDPVLTEVGPGTPCGEFMRRYWHPVAVATNVTARPQKVRFLGEDLILFRDRKGRPGLLYPRCMHRGTTLFYGKVEDEGIRCCYHGWLFGVDGTCLDQPCEPEHGLHRDVARQPWYPVEERYGLVFAYMGPPEKKPLLTRWDVLEDVEFHGKDLGKWSLDRGGRRSHGRDRPLQLVAGLGEYHGPIPSPNSSHQFQRHPVRARVRHHADRDVEL